MRNTCLSILSFLVLFFTSCSGSKHATGSKLPGTWQATPIIVDGDGADWPAPYPNYDSKARIGFATSNDADYLYLTIETGDEYTQTKILKAGMTLWIDTSAGKEQNMSVHYPMPGDDNPLNLPRTQNAAGQSKDPAVAEYHKAEAAKKLKNSIMGATQITLEGFGDCDGGHIVSQNKCGIKVRIGIDSYGELIWEAAIPFKTIYHKEHLDKQDAGRPISVCFAIKGFKKPSENNNSSQSTSTNGGGGGNSDMGGGRGGGGRGGHGGGRTQNNGTSERDHLFESTKTWKQFGLVYQ